MFRRSTNTIGYTHHGGDITAQVNSSHGVRLTGGSTGGIVESVGDDTNVTLTLRAQGAGGVVIGNSSQAVTLAGPSTGFIASTHISLNSSRVQFAGSTTTFIAIRRVRIDFTVPAMAANAGAEVGDIAVTGLTTNAAITLAPRGPLNSSVAGLMAMAFCSTAAEMHVTLQNAGTTISGSTMSAYALIHDMNIPVA